MTESSEKQLPERLSSPCAIGEASGKVEIWSGDAKLKRGSKIVLGEAKLCLRFIPKPFINIEFTIRTAPEENDLLSRLNDYESLGEYELECGNPLGTLSVNIFSLKNGRLYSGAVNSYSPLIKSDLSLSSLKYLVINGPNLFGKVLKGSGTVFEGRTEAEIAGTKIIVDQIINKDRVVEKSYVFSHLIEVQLEEGSTNTNIEKLGQSIHRTLSFMSGRWVGLVGPWGYSKSSELRYIQPKLELTGLNGSELSWYYEMMNGAFSNLFPCVHNALSEPQLSDVLNSVISWYIESEQVAGMIEGSIILQQSALETLSWYEVVERRQLCSVQGFKKLPTSDKIRLLLSLYSIPSAIPSKCEDIMAYAKEYNLVDLLEVLADVRNALVHGAPNRVGGLLTRKLFKRDNGFQERCELWYQVSGILAQSILAVFNYQGDIRCRVSDNVFIHSTVKNVPWKKGDILS